ncbi:hypothetical protein G8759_20075 [Spirosoma aureum]|uniref:Uncharacterized protein n=1 Tax=Spirosoma aureum TaxID=2692134 RepID=A0A6G9AQR9_9BACT|nr:hypothetical protein [Spirosoma aureum]QIP14750.1 hypothetical protein G8759_20075 [Spirosoma aureum]
MSEQEYIDYFEYLARQHKALLHTDTEPRFYVLRDDNRADLEQAVRSKLLLPALVLDQYYDDLDRSSDNFRATILGGLSVLVKCKKQDPDDVRRARAEARQLALSFINRMYRDCRHPNGILASKRINPSMQFQGEPAPILAEIATGWGYPFEWSMPTSVAVSPDDWADLP